MRIRFVIHFEDKGNYSADDLLANDEDEAMEIFEMWHPNAKILKVRPLVVDTKVKPKMIEVKIFHNGG